MSQPLGSDANAPPSAESPAERELTSGDEAEEEPWVDLEFPGHSWKLLHGVPEETAPGEQAILRSYAAGAKKAVID